MIAVNQISPSNTPTPLSTVSPNEVTLISPHEHPYRWAILGGVWLIYFSFGLLAAAMAPLVAVISQDLGISYTSMGFILGAWPLVYIVAALPGGALIDRVGLRWSLFFAAAIMAGSGALRAIATSSLSLFLAVAIFGIGGPLISIGAPKAIAKWFRGSERGFAMGIYMTGPALGGILALSLTNSVLMPLTDGDWREVLLIYSAVVVAAGFVWFAFASHSANRNVESSESQIGSIAKQLAVFGQLLRLRAVQLVLTMSVGIFFFFHTLGNWLPEILRSGGMDAKTAGLWASAPTAIGIVASLIIPRLATPRRRFGILLGLFICEAAGALLLLTTALPGLAAAVVLLGITRGALMTIMILVLMETRGVDPRHMGAAGGLFFSAAEIGGVMGPSTTGALSDATGSFDASLLVLAAIGAAMFVLMFFHRASERRAAETGAQSPAS